MRQCWEILRNERSDSNLLILSIQCFLFVFSTETGKLATNELPLAESQIDGNSSNTDNPTSVFSHTTIAEDEEEADTPKVAVTDSQHLRSTANDKKYTWRIDLSKSEEYWPGWFENLSMKFLNLRVPKLLLLASIDGLDRALTVGQMQGKFQMQVLARCGHAVHEVIFKVFQYFHVAMSKLFFYFLQDRPDEVAEVIAGYMIRNKFAEPCADFTRHSPSC